MSQVNFDNLISKHGHSKRALRQLENWINEHADVRVLNPSTLAREIKGVDPVSLTEALMILVKAGELRRVYKVTTPSGTLADREFDDPREIPDRLPDRFEHYFDTSESDVIPVFQKVA
jgi:hypothetical protein